MSTLKAVVFDCFGVIYCHEQCDMDLLTYINEELSPQYKIGLLSNTSQETFGRVVDPSLQSVFDVQVLSEEVGVQKPSERIYHIVQERLALPFEEILFVDDRDDFLVPARELGMQTICYTNFMKFKEEFSQHKAL